MRSAEFDEAVFFRAIHESGARALLIAGGHSSSWDCPAVTVHMPVVDDLILTKRFADRQKDLEDIRLLRAMLESDS